MKRIYVLLLPLLFLALTVPHVMAQTAVATYTFSGDTRDLSATGNDATNVGATFTQDRFGVANSALHFDGVASRVWAPNDPALLTPTATVSFWVKPETFAASGEDYLISFGGWQERYKVSLPGAAKPVWTTNATGISDMDSGDGNVLTLDKWDHLVFVHDGTNDKIYMNGVLVASKAVAGDLNTTDKVLGIGYDAVDGGSFFNGDLDDIVIYDGALDDAAVAALFAEQSVSPVFPDGLVAYYPFDGNLRDESDYKNHAKGKDIEFTTDKFGFGDQAAEFNGTTSQVTAANSAHLNSATTTVMFWVKANSLPASGEAYLASFGGWQERWKISLPSHGKMVWTTHAATCCSDLDAGGGNELVVGEWLHAAFVHDGVEDKIYINGVQVASKAAPGALASTVHPLGIGYDPIDMANYFDGVIDEFQIYNVALTDVDITDIYNEQNMAVIDPDPKVLDLPFTGDFRDVSQFHNDGESYNAELTYDRFGLANNAVDIEDGVQAYVEVANSPQYNSDYTTVSFWVNMDELPGTGEVYLLSFGGWQERWKISLPSHGKVVWTTYGSTCCSDLDAGAGNELVPGTWAHVVTVHGTVQDKIFINGVLVASKDNNGPLHDTGYELGIGWDPIDRGNFMDGKIDEVRIYNEALTDQQVADLYTAQSLAPSFPGNIVADYRLDGSGFDSSPYRNHGDVLGATASADQFGRSNHAMNFDGNDGIRADNSPQLNGPVTSVSFWVKPNSLPASGEAYLLSFGGWQERWKISLPSHGKVVWTTHAATCCSDLDAGGGNELVAGEWDHLVMVHDGTKDYIYMNGVEVASKDAPGDLANTVHPLGIGYDPIDNANYFDGMLDNVLIFETALSAAEVAALYAEQAGAPVVSDVTAPDAPANLCATVSFTNINLTWTESEDLESGIAGYNVYLNSSLYQTVTETEIDLLGLAPLTTYEIGVSAVDSAGNESNVTVIFVTTGMDETPDTEAPSNPSNLVVSPGSNSAVFSWDPSTDNVGVAGYVVSVDGVFVDSLPGDQTSIFIGGLTSSTLYAFEVYAFDFAGNNSEVVFIVGETTEPIETAEPGLVAHYKFEGDANDATPYNNHGSIGGNPTFENATHPNNSGLNIVFDGVGDSVLVPNAVQLISDYATVGFWVRPDNQNLNDPESYLIDFGHWDERWKISLPQHLKVVWTTNSKNAQFDHFISDMDSGDGNELVLGFWWYVTMVHDGTDDIIYLDGVEVNRKPVNGTLNSTGRPLGIGNNPIDGGQYFIGGMDEVKIYNKALTSDEILQLYQTGSTVTGIDDLDEVNKYVEVIYPNPTKDDVLIKHGFGTSNDLLIRIFDQSGRQVDARRIQPNQMNTGVITLNVANLQNAMYSLNFVLDGKNLGSIPFVKQ
jgi:hypothetical protein